MSRLSSNLKGVSYLLLAFLILSLQNIAIKYLGGDYCVLEIVTFRTFIALPITILLYRMEGGRGLPRTKRHKLEYLRGILLFLSYTTHLMGLAALPLAQIGSIRYSGPLMITLLSVLLLGEKVGPRQWVALLVGFGGVLYIVQPASAAFDPGALFILVSVLLYAFTVIITSKLQDSESSATMSYFSAVVYLVVGSVLSPLVALIAEAPAAHPSIAFLLRSWSVPTFLDWAIMSGLGLVWAGGMFFIAQAYSQAPASVIAPFEYMSLPINTLWGFVFWQEVPTLTTLAGAALALASGLYILYRNQNKKTPPPGELVVGEG